MITVKIFCHHQVKVVAVAMLVMLTPYPLNAGEIALKNGDLMSGDLIEIKSDKITWQSSVFGTLSIPKEQVLRIETESPLKIRGESEPCFWRGIMAADALFECNEELTTIPFLAIQQISRYEIHHEVTKDFTGKVFVAGSQSSGNKEEVSWVADANSTIRYTDFRHDMRYAYDVKSIDNSPELEHYRVEYDFNWFFAPQTYWIWAVDQERDDAKNIERRTSLGTGLGYQFWESKRTTFSLETGADQVDEVVVSTLENSEQELIEQNQYASLQLTSNFSYVFPHSISFYNRNVFSQSLDESNDWKANTETGVSLPFGFGISADIKLQYEFQNSPPGDNKKEDATLRFGIGYNW